MMDIIHIELEFPPTINSYYGQTKRGIKYITKRGKLFREGVLQSCFEQNAFGLSLEDRLQLDVILYPPDKRTRDLDNYMKALLDAMTHSKVWVDDEQVDGLAIHRGKVVKGGKCAVRVSMHHGLILPDDPAVWDYID